MRSLEQLIANRSNCNIEKLLSSEKLIVLLVKCLSDSKHYVMKTYSSDNAALLQSVIQEKSMHATLSHPNIIKYIPTELFFQENSPDHVIAMENAPHGDLLNFLIEYGLNDEILIRTFFHNLIQGLEYLHSQNVAHLDLKLENLLLGEDFQLKIADFDVSRQIPVKKERLIVSGGTQNYRPPEVLAGTCRDYSAVDIYSAGVCLYIMMAGAFPFNEEERSRGYRNLFRYDLFMRDNDKFWEENENFTNGRVKFSETFKTLLNGVWAEDPAERLTLEGIKKSRWYNEPIYTQEELKTQMEIKIKH